MDEDKPFLGKDRRHTWFVIYANQTKSREFNDYKEAYSFLKKVRIDYDKSKAHRHAFDDSVGYGVHCVKCGFQPKRRSDIASIKKTGKMGRYSSKRSTRRQRKSSRLGEVY